MRSKPGVERAIVAVSPMHRRRRTAVRVDAARPEAATAEAATEPPLPQVVLPTPTWSLNTLIPTEVGADAIGWVVLGPDGNRGVGFRVASRIVDDPVIGLERPDAPGGASTDGDAIGFTFNVTNEELAAATWTSPLEIAVVRDDVALHELSYWYPGDAGLVAPPENRLRVSGNYDLTAFLLEGFTLLHTLERVYRRWSPVPLTSCGTLLDWGTGCGRFARYLEPHIGDNLQLVGIDVDPTNITWCRQHMPWGTFHVVDGSPPTPLDDDSTDVVVGISVFTHLRTELEQAWLGELRRVSRPGGLLLITTISTANFARSGLGPEVYQHLLDDGVLDVGRNDGIDGAVDDDPDYYRNVFITAEHVRSTWTEHFDVLAHEPARIGNHQDLWVLRSR